MIRLGRIKPRASVVMSYHELADALGLPPEMQIAHVEGRHNPDQVVLTVDGPEFSPVEAGYSQAPPVPWERITRKGGSDG